MKPTTTNKPILTTACRLVTLVALILGLTNIIVSNQLSTEGRTLANITGEIITLEKEVSFLNQQIAAESSLAQVETRALSLGFIGIERPLALTTPEPVALVTE